MLANGTTGTGVDDLLSLKLRSESQVVPKEQKEEFVVDGILCWREKPWHPWVPYTATELTKRIEKLETFAAWREEYVTLDAAAVERLYALKQEAPVFVPKRQKGPRYRDQW